MSQRDNKDVLEIFSKNFTNNVFLLKFWFLSFTYEIYGKNLFIYKQQIS